MFTFYIATTVIILTGVFAYINQKFLRLPNTIGLMLISTVFSVLLIIFNLFSPKILLPVIDVINDLDFSKILLDVLLCFLLFAGAMHTDYTLLKRNRKSILLFSLVSVIISTFFVGTSVYLITLLFGIKMNFLYALLFGALMSPTDPIAILGILTKAKVPKDAEIIIVGESLFNDGIGVVVFLSLLSLIDKGAANVGITDVFILFMQQAVGGVVLGLILGYIIFILLKSINDYETEIIITLAVVLGGNWLAHSLHVSGPLAMVVAGLMTGHKSRREAVTNTNMLYLDKFWHLVDVLMNAILFVLMGLKILSIHFEWQYLGLAFCVIPLLLVCRYLALALPYSIAGNLLNVSTSTLKVMTWGGLRGGLSIAMALSLSNSIIVKDELVFITYVVVFFSIFIQGLTIEKFARKIYNQQ